LNRSENSGSERRLTNQSPHGWQHGEPTVATHQSVEFSGIYEAASKSFESATQLAHQHNPRTVTEHKTVIPAQKFTAQPGEKEIAECLLMNGRYARKILIHGFPDGAGSAASDLYLIFVHGISLCHRRPAFG
jgi:hypothetical protein